MVSFRAIAAAFAAGLLVSFTTAAITPQEITSNLRTLTVKSQDLQRPAQSITIINGPLIVIGQGPFPVIITGFADIITLATGYINAMQDNEVIKNPNESQAVYDAFREFVRVHQVLLNILIGKAGLFQTVPFVGEPIASVLRQLENVVDAIAFKLIDIAENNSADMQAQANSLAATIDTAIRSYDGIAQVKRRDLADVKEGLVAHAWVA